MAVSFGDTFTLTLLTDDPAGPYGWKWLRRSHPGTPLTRAHEMIGFVAVAGEGPRYLQTLAELALPVRR